MTRTGRRPALDGYAFADTPKGEECTAETIHTAIEEMIGLFDTIFREILSQVPERQKELLYAIAKAGEAQQILSGNFLKQHRLASASSVQAATRKLLDRDLISENNKTYSLTNKLFAMWINRVYGKG